MSETSYPSESQLILNTIISHIPAMVFYKNLDGVYIAANEMFCNQLRTTPAEITGKTDYNFYPTEVADRYRDADLFVINSGEMLEGFEEEIDIDGDHRIFESKKVLIRDQQGIPHGIIGLAYDVTRQKQMEKELKSLANHNQAIIKALPDLVFLFDESANYLDCYISNTSELLVSPSAFFGKNISDFFDQTITNKTQQAILECLKTDSIQTFEYSISQNGPIMYFEARFIKVEASQVMCLSRNITERISLQKDLVLAKEKAEDSSRLKSALINNITHELHTPLNGILGFSDILKQEINDPGHQEMASHIYDSGKRLMKTLDSIMMLSQLESGVMQLHFDYLNLNQLLRQITERYTKQAGDKGLTIEVIKTKSILGYIDKYFFSQAFSHVLENAIKFTNQGGVGIKAKTCTVKKSRHLSITITDSGIGISKANQKLIFEEFRQASEGYTRNYEGSGLGLTIAGKLIQHLGGKVEVESTLGAGSVFRITIPLPNQPVDNYPALP